MTDRPKNYCTEDTPGVFSRADSLSSLESEHQNDYRRHLAANAAAEAEAEEEKGQLEAKLGGEKEEASLTPPLPRRRLSETSGSHHPHQQPPMKTVTFNPQETPLVFSRHSSFESLNSCDQHSIRTGYSSCDFSRMTSGRVSPSDLPDSPCQSRPYSPHKMQQQQQQRRAPTNGAAGFPSVRTAALTSTAPHTSTALVPPAAVGFSQLRNQLLDEPAKPKVPSSDFDEDEVPVAKTYKEEGTPAIFSSRTSLSGLTFTDDEHDDVERRPLPNNANLVSSFFVSICYITEGMLQLFII